jgi:hypothetical protein
VLVATGANDGIFPEEVGRQILTDHRDAEYHALPTGHFTLEDKAAEIAAPAEPGMIPLTIRRSAACSQPVSSGRTRPDAPRAGLNWRRRHQARTRGYHQRPRLARDGGITLVS